MTAQSLSLGWIHVITKLAVLQRVGLFRRKKTTMGLLSQVLSRSFWSFFEMAQFHSNTTTPACDHVLAIDGYKLMSLRAVGRSVFYCLISMLGILFLLSNSSLCV